GGFSYHALWQVGRLLFENNVVELVLNIIASGWEAPVAVNLCDTTGSHGSQFLYQQAIIRGNVIRQVDNASDSSNIPIAVFLDSCANAIVENNHINLDTDKPLHQCAVGSIKYFNNQTPAGLLLQGASFSKAYAYGVLIFKDDTLNQFLNELATVADLALSLSS